MATIKQSPQKLGTASLWLDYLLDKYQGKTTNPWVEQLKDSLLDWRQETNDTEVSNHQTLEFLYETLSEQRRDRRMGKGVFLTTVHSVKGMEFAHVLIVDGGWKGKDVEVQRRLLYVAMTRAKETLSLMQCNDNNNPFLQEINGDFCLLRAATVNEQDFNTVRSRDYFMLGLQDLDISYAGGHGANHIIHQQLQSLEYSSCLTMVKDEKGIFLKYGGVLVAKLSEKARNYWIDKLASIKTINVIAMIKRCREESQESYRYRCKVENWEIPIVELVCCPLTT